MTATDPERSATTDRELLDALVAALRPLLDPDFCSPFMSAWELDPHHTDINIDGEDIHDRIKALVAQYDGEGRG